MYLEGGTIALIVVGFMILGAAANEAAARYFANKYKKPFKD